MVLVVGETFVNLSFSEVGKTVSRHSIDGLAILEQSNDVVHANTGTFYSRVAAANAGRPDNVTIGFRD